MQADRQLDARARQGSLSESLLPAFANEPTLPVRPDRRSQQRAWRHLLGVKTRARRGAVELPAQRPSQSSGPIVPPTVQPATATSRSRSRARHRSGHRSLSNAATPGASVLPSQATAPGHRPPRCRCQRRYPRQDECGCRPGLHERRARRQSRARGACRHLASDPVKAVASAGLELALAAENEHQRRRADGPNDPFADERKPRWRRRCCHLPTANKGPLSPWNEPNTLAASAQHGGLIDDRHSAHEFRSSMAGVKRPESVRSAIQQPCPPPPGHLGRPRPAARVARRVRLEA